MNQRVVYIKWKDAMGADGWVSSREVTEARLAIIEFVGYLVREDEESVTITMGHDEANSNCGAYAVIPKVNIIKKRYLT